MTSRLVALCAILVPSLAVAQPPAPSQPAPAPSSPPPTVIVNPPPPPAPMTAGGPQYETVYDTWNAPVFTTGALLFLGSYGASVIVAGSADEDELDNGVEYLYVPVVGPWLTLSDRRSCPIGETDCDNATTYRVLLAADGLFQGAGVITMISGILQPTAHRVPMRTAKLDKKLRITPTTYAGTGAGLTVLGRF
jgi:hypothetical protein